MEDNINIWLIGNTGLRNPNRIFEGFKAFSKSPYVANLRGKPNEIGFMNFLNYEGVIHNEKGKDSSGSHARKWRLMFAKNGLIFPQYSKKKTEQDKLGTLDDITPFGKSFLLADTYPAIQEHFLRAMSVEQFQLPNSDQLYSPLRWILALMLELEKRTGSSEISRIEFALWGQTTNPSFNVSEVVDKILDLRIRRKKAPSKRVFDKAEIEKRGAHYNLNNKNFTDYADMNMRYLRMTGILQRKGRGLMIVPTKKIIAKQLAKETTSSLSLFETYQILINGAPLPTDNLKTAKEILNELQKQLKERRILYNISDLDLEDITQINIARRRLEQLLSENNEIRYAAEQPKQWKEILKYMDLLISGKSKLVDEEEDVVYEIPKEDRAVYLEWILWRAALAIDHLINLPYEIRGFSLDSDFMPISVAGGGRGDLYMDFKDFLILTEVTLSTSSRQESMEGEPVRRHISDAILNYNKDVYGLFIARSVNINTIETFRHGLWYTLDKELQHLQILPLSLLQFRNYFNMMFQTNQVHPIHLKNLITTTMKNKDNLSAIEWEKEIETIINSYI